MSYNSQERILTREKITRFINTWENAGYTEDELLIENFTQEPRDPNGDTIPLTLKDLKILLEMSYLYGK